MKRFLMSSVPAVLVGVIAAFAGLRWGVHDSGEYIPPPTTFYKDVPKPPVGIKVADFSLLNDAGKGVALADFGTKNAIVLYFMGTQCPISNLYLKQLDDFQRQYAQSGVQVVGIHSNAGITADDVRNHSREYRVEFPTLLDSEQRVADSLGATRTAEVFLLDKQHVVRFHGRIDDRFGYTYKHALPGRRDLEEATKEVLAGKDVTISSTEPMGCLITRSSSAKQDGNVTYAKHISRILNEHCVECHRPGFSAPFSLLTYDDAVKHTAMMKEVVLEGRMPPWHADPRYGKWADHRQMPRDEIDSLVTWIDAGAPLGDTNDLPPPLVFDTGWSIGKPDLVFDIPAEVVVPADGVIPYQYFRVPTNFDRDVLIEAGEARPGNAAVVHHIIVYHCEPGSDDFREEGAICGISPGGPPTLLPPGIALRIPAGSELVFEVHYTPTGKAETDLSRVGFTLYKGEMPPKGLAQSMGILNNQFEIPAGDPNYLVEKSYTFPYEATLLGLSPHMHFRGKDFLYSATYPDGTSEILLYVPRYDFNWQNMYRFATPRKVPKGTRIDCFAHFDNSADNPANPDPTKPVRWGRQTWQEMMVGFVAFYRETTSVAGKSQ